MTPPCPDAAGAGGSGVDRSRRQAGIAALAAGSVVLATALGACGNPDTDRTDGEVRSYVDGAATSSPLSVYAGRGGFAADPASHVPWEFSYGTFFPCVTKPGTEATITKVVPHVSKEAPPLAVTTWLRITTRAAVQRTPAAERPDFEAVNSIGAPPTWRDPQRTFVAKGAWSKHVAGTRVTTDCRQRSNQQGDVTAGRVQTIPKVYELVFTLKVGAAGGAVDGFDVHFTADGKDAVLRVPWTITACGSSRALQSRCRQSVAHATGN